MRRIENIIPVLLLKYFHNSVINTIIKYKNTLAIILTIITISAIH
jgi:hypothetical protein